MKSVLFESKSMFSGPEFSPPHSSMIFDGGRRCCGRWVGGGWWMVEGGGGVELESEFARSSVGRRSTVDDKAKLHSRDNQNSLVKFKRVFWGRFFLKNLEKSKKIAKIHRRPPSSQPFVNQHTLISLSRAKI